MPVHKGLNFSRQDAKLPLLLTLLTYIPVGKGAKKELFMIFVTTSYNFAIFASLRELIFLDGH